MIGSTVFWLLCLFQCMYKYGVHGTTISDYCSFPNTQWKASMAIPDLPIDTSLVLDQVHVIHRHGTRTPKTFSWELYLGKFGIADSDVKFGDAITTTYTVSVPGELTTKESQHMIAYDANKEEHISASGYAQGQLTADAYVQLKMIGENLNEKYFCATCPFKDLDLKNINDWLYHRTTDTLRTMHSGALLIQTALNTTENEDTPPIVTHTNDYLSDSMNDREIAHCTDEKLVYKAFESAFLDSLRSKHKDLRYELESITGLQFRDFLDIGYFDVLTSLACHNQSSLLGALGDISTEKSKGTQFYDAMVAENIAFSSSNNGSFMKCSINNFMSDFLNGINAKRNNNDPNEPNTQKESKFLVYSGHDNIIYGFLMSLGEGVYDNNWPKFGSTIVLENYKLGTEKNAFRLLYNGLDITSSVPKCKDSQEMKDHGVCNMRYFFDATSWAKYHELQIIIPVIYQFVYVGYFLFFLGFSVSILCVCLGCLCAKFFTRPKKISSAFQRFHH